MDITKAQTLTSSAHIDLSSIHTLWIHKTYFLDMTNRTEVDTTYWWVQRKSHSHINHLMHDHVKPKKI